MKWATFRWLAEHGYAPHAHGRLLLGGIPRGHDTLLLEVGSRAWTKAEPRVDWRLTPEDCKGAA